MANYCLSFSQLFFDNSSWNNNVQIFDWEIRQTSEIRGLWKRSARVFHFARDAAELSEVRRSRRKHPEDHYPTLCAFNPSRDHYHLFWQPCAGIGIRTFAENESAEFIITSSLLVPRFAIGIMACRRYTLEAEWKFRLHVQRYAIWSSFRVRVQVLANLRSIGCFLSFLFDFVTWYATFFTRIFYIIFHDLSASSPLRANHQSVLRFCY